MLPLFLFSCDVPEPQEPAGPFDSMWEAPQMPTDVYATDTGTEFVPWREQCDGKPPRVSGFEGRIKLEAGDRRSVASFEGPGQICGAWCDYEEVKLWLGGATGRARIPCELNPGDYLELHVVTTLFTLRSKSTCWVVYPEGERDEIHVQVIYP